MKASMTRRQFLKLGAVAGGALFLPIGAGQTRLLPLLERAANAAAFATPMDPTGISKFVSPLVIPPAMPRTKKIPVKAAKNIEYFEIAMRQFQQQILPAIDGFGPTTVWSYGSVNHPGSFNYPAFTIEAKYKKPVRVKWINDLKDANGNYLPYLLPVDPTLHWANPPGGIDGRDMHSMFDTTPDPYTGPVPIVTHVHGAHTGEESDGYTEAWYLPDAAVPPGYATVGTWYDTFKAQAEATLGQPWTAGSAVFQYPNDQAASTLWYHDHALGMTRLNVYAGPAGFYILRGGPTDAVVGTLPGPAPALGDPAGTKYYEIPIAIQDRSFYSDGSLFYPDSREFFDGYAGPYIPDTHIPPLWNPEFFGNTMVVNGTAWPMLNVEQRRYRFRFLNGCNSRFLILRMSDGGTFWQIGGDGGYLPAPAPLTELVMAPAERCDVIVDFTSIPVGTTIQLLNMGPDAPFGGGAPGVDFDPANPDTTGNVMRFVVGPRVGPDTSTPPSQLILPQPPTLPPATVTRKLSLNEHLHEVGDNSEAPIAALLGSVQVDDNGVITGTPQLWMDDITETPAVGSTEIWEFYNFTADAHPMHLHLVMFEVVNREAMVLHPDTDDVIGLSGVVRPPEPGEAGRKDTVIAYPGDVTRVRATFDRKGLYVWHCHIVEHEDNEMMRPYRVI